MELSVEIVNHPGHGGSKGVFQNQESPIEFEKYLWDDQLVPADRTGITTGCTVPSQQG